jgi:hypothetical protein
MAGAIKSALPTHLRPEDGEGAFERRHGKTRSHMVGPIFPLLLSRDANHHSTALFAPIRRAWEAISSSQSPGHGHVSELESPSLSNRHGVAHCQPTSFLPYLTRRLNLGTGSWLSEEGSFENFARQIPIHHANVPGTAELAPFFSPSLGDLTAKVGVEGELHHATPQSTDAVPRIMH